MPSNFNIPQKRAVSRIETARNTFRNSSTATITENGCSGRLWASIVIHLLKLLSLWGIGPMGQRNWHIFRFLSSLHLGDWLLSVTEFVNQIIHDVLLRDLELCSDGLMTGLVRRRSVLSLLLQMGHWPRPGPEPSRLPNSFPVLGSLANDKWGPWRGTEKYLLQSHLLIGEDAGSWLSRTGLNKNTYY